jgi:hypothetical protein
MAPFWQPPELAGILSQESVLHHRDWDYSDCAHRIAFRKAAVLETTAIPRSASAGASSRNAARFKAPRGITRFQRTRSGGNQRLHPNTATLVTPTVRFPVPNYLTTNNER